jgi:hypothetical protein
LLISCLANCTKQAGELRNAQKTVVGNPEEETPLGIRLKLENYISMA